MITNTYIGRNAQNFEKQPSVTVDRVIVKVDDENNYYSPSGLTQAQWDAMTGKIVTVSIPFGTQAMADSIRSTLSSKAFLPYKATFAELDPAAELGDWVTADGIYSVIAKRTFNLNSLGSSEVSAETENEVTDKYPYLSKAEAEVQMSLAGFSSRLTVAEDSIDAEVIARQNADDALSDEIEDRVPYTELSTKIGQYIDTSAGTSKIISACSGTYLTQTSASNTYLTQTSAANTYATVTRASTIEQTISADEAKIALVVTQSGGNNVVNTSGICTAINNAGSSITINADKIKMTGTTTFLKASDVGEDGETSIDGGRILTGTISADRISTNISTVAKYLYVGGNTSYTEGAGIYLGNQIQILKTNGASYFIANSYPLAINCASYITLSGTYIDLSASTVYTGNTISMGASSWGISEISSSGNIQLSPSSSGYVVITSAVCGYSSFRPISNAGLDLGSSSYKWGNAYCATGAWSGSDRNNKKDIDYDIDSMDSFFDNIRPCSYKFKDGTSGRTHYGFIAQDIEDNLTSEGLTGTDFAGFGKDKLMKAEYDDDGHFLREVETNTDTYFLRYEEFIALCVSQIQKLKARVTELETNAN